MQKRRKIKHYSRKGNFDSPNRITPLRVLGVTVLVFVLAFIGWSSYEPVSEFIKHYSQSLSEIPSQKEQNEAFAEESNNSSSEISQGGISSENQIHSILEREDNQGEPVGNMNALYIPEDYITNFQKAYDYFMAKSEKIGAEAVVINIKDESGIINLPVKNEIAEKNDAIYGEAEKVLETVKAFKEKGVRVYGIVSVFKDPLAPLKNDKMRITYLNTVYTWYDAAPEDGGKPWMNPYSPFSHEYIIDLCKQFYKFGVDKILFSNVSFPTGEALDKAEYGMFVNGRSKQEALSDFADKAAGNFKEGQYLFMLDARDAVKINEKVYGGNPLDIFSNNIVLTLSAKSLDETFKIGGESYENSGNTVEITKILLKGFKEQLDNKGNAIAVYEKELTSVEDMKNVIEEYNIKGLIVL